MKGKFKKVQMRGMEGRGRMEKGTRWKCIQVSAPEGNKRPCYNSLPCVFRCGCLFLQFVVGIHCICQFVSTCNSCDF